MSDIFHDREQGYEAKYKLDEETRFKALARRNRKLGLWAAERIGHAGPKAEAYAREVVEANFNEPGDAEVIRKVADDLASAGRPAERDEIARQLDLFFATAMQELGRDFPQPLGEDHHL